MQQVLTLLRKLQEYDLQIQEIDARTAKLRESLDELYEVHESLKDSLDAQNSALDETRGLMREKQEELTQNEERYKQSKGKLNQVSNTREYNALEKEMDALKKMRAQLEEEHDSLRDAVADYEADVDDKTEKTAELAKQIAAEESVVKKESGSATKRIEKLREDRITVRSEIPKNIARRYEFIASRRPGRAVVAARDGVCSGCNMLVPPQLYNELQQNRKLIQCQSCQRVLYYDPEVDETAEAS